MGKDKGSLIINGKAMINHTLDVLDGNINELVIVLNDEKRIAKYQEIIDIKKYSYSIKFITDEIKNKGPLSGIMTGLKKIENDYALILPCDSPFISKKFLNFIFNKLNNFNKDALIIYHPLNDTDNLNIKINNSEPLHSIYSKNNYKLIEELIKKDALDVKSLIKKIECEFVKIDNKNILKKDIKNLNNLEDLKLLDIS